MFGLGLKTVLLGAAIAALGVGYGAIKDGQTQRALRDRDAALTSLQTIRGELQNCAVRLLDIREDTASDLEIDQIPDELLSDRVPPHWLRDPPAGDVGN